MLVNMNFEIIYSSRRTVSLSVKEGKLLVRAPYGTKESRINEIIKAHSAWIEKHLKKQEEKAKLHPEPTAEEEARLRNLAREILPAKTEHYAKIMGLKYSRITITGAKTRFGSCSSKGNIAYSFRIMSYPDEAVDYVVVHELSHLVEMNHSKNFYKLVESVLPDYKERAKLLKK